MTVVPFEKVLLYGEQIRSGTAEPVAAAREKLMDTLRFFWQLCPLI
jgi:hypothetical protein